MQTIVITGGTRGIGYGLAEAFLERGCQVAICGRSQASVDVATASLAQSYDAQRILGVACDVRSSNQAQNLWNRAKEHFGRIDIWINNAGLSHPVMSLWELDPDTVSAVIETNITGVLNGCRVAIKGMIEQGGGHIYNMEGRGSKGNRIPQYLPYGTSKYALRYLTETLTKETQDTPVKVSSISPGMVITDLLLGDIDADHLERVKGIFNVLADKVETVTPWVADRVLANTRTGARIVWLTRPRIMARFALSPFRKRDLFAE